MGLGDKLLDKTYVPDIENIPVYSPNQFSTYGKIIKCPVRFTNDMIEYCESKEFLNLKLRTLQKKFLEEMFSVNENNFPIYNEGVLCCGMRSGKSHGYGTPILMHDGTIKNIEDIKINDLVMGPDSLPRKVINISRGESELFEIQQSSAMTYIINDYHILSLKKDKFIKVKNKYLTYPDIINIPIDRYLKQSKEWRSLYKGYKADFIINNEFKLSSLKVSSVGQGKYAGIAVDGDHLYCLADGTVTHNSWTAAFIATGMLQMLLQEDNVTDRFNLVKGTRITAQCLASTEVQSKETAFAAIKSIIKYSDYWRKYIQYLIDRENNGEGKESLFQSLNQTVEFKEKNLAILSLNSSSSALAGKSSFLVILDELSRLATIEGSVSGKTENRTAEAVYSTVSRSIMSLKGFGKVITVSSPLYEDDYTMKLVKMAGKCDVGSQAYIINALRNKEPKKISTIYALHATTYEFNPDITEEDLASEKEKNFFTYNRDYLAVPSSAINPFFEHYDRINICVNNNREAVALFEDKLIEETVKSNAGVETRTYIGKTIFPQTHDRITKYFICCDAGEKKDSFCVALGHSEAVSLELPTAEGKINKIEKYKVIIDLIEEWRPNPKEKITVSFQNVEEILLILNQYFRIDSILFDRWQSTESIEILFSQGIHTERIGANIEMYETLKMLVYANMIEFPNNDKLVSELRQLNRIRSSSGNEKVEHPPESSKDLADAVVRVAWMVYNDSIKSATRGEFIMPIVQRFSTVRGAAQYFEEQKNNGSSDAIWGSGSSQGSPFGGNNDSLFGGSDTYIRGNVQGDFRKNK